MKKIRFFLTLALVALSVVSCKPDPEQVTTLHTLKVAGPEFRSEDTKMHLTFNANGVASKLSYDNGDIIAVNGRRYELQEGMEYWTATPLDGDVSASTYYCYYGHNAHLTGYNEADGTINFNLSNTFSEDDISNSTGILLAGSTNNDIVTLVPACCIIRFKGTGIRGVKVGFDDGVVPKRGILSGADEEMTEATAYFIGVTEDGDGQFLKMVRGDGDWYVAVPVLGNSIQTTLYFEWEKSNAGTVRRKTSGSVTLRKGYIYTIGEGSVSPWDEDGASKSVFQVGENNYVFFSSGNLQCQPYQRSPRANNIFKFAQHQYDVIGTFNEEIDGRLTELIDLMGWGTSGWTNSGATCYAPGSASTLDVNYIPGGDPLNDLTGDYANADWGVYNSDNIYYFSKKNTGAWRTLSRDEWDFLLNSRRGAANKWGIGTIESIKGLIILPDSWTLPTNITFSPGKESGYSTNTYTLDTWDKMEKAGAIFLPAGGWRLGNMDINDNSVRDVNSKGYYWTTTHGENVDNACCLIISTRGVQLTETGRATGCNIRLVKQSTD